MIYPNNFESKIGFNDIRSLLKGQCLSTLGIEQVDALSFSVDCSEVNERLQQVKEFIRLTDVADDFPMQYFFDVRESVARIRLAGTHLEEQEVYDLRRSLETISQIVAYLNKGEEGAYDYPALQRLTQDITVRFTIFEAVYKGFNFHNQTSIFR